ncbi:MAG: hypothetical protein Kow0081_3570 [Candidatus Dojkabacteria bacterium]
MILFYKNIAETPLEAIMRFRAENPRFAESKIAYAGRLDPMAEGYLLLLIDNECKIRDKYQGLNKTYEFEFIFGIETDSLDLLGIPTATSEKELHGFQITKADLENIIKGFEGVLSQELPVYSSYTVKGTPLWKWAKEKRLDEIKIPSKEVQIFSAELLSLSEITFGEIKKRVNLSVGKVKGNFRQSEILSAWNALDIDNNSELVIAKARFNVSSGTYIRQIVKDIGKLAKMKTVAYSIVRTGFDLDR